MKLFILTLCTVFTFAAQAVPTSAAATKPTDAIGLDVRTPEELVENPAPGAINIPVDDLKDQAELKLKDKNANILIFCRSGNRSKRGKVILEELGYKHVTNIGTWKDWNNLKR